jgi:ABC-type dipeptide/oligopeptide/nickel transport system permease subunit
MSPTVLGYGFLAVLAFAAIFGPHFARFSPADINVGPRLSPPDQVYYFGTDALGRDLFSRVVYGLRISLWISLMATLIAAFPGIVLGMISGYYRGWTDQIFSRGIDVLLALPGLLLAIVLIARLGPSMTTLILAMGITAIPTFYRVARNETMSLSTHLFIEAGRSIGLTDFQLIFRYILPNINSALLALISMRLGIFLLMGSGLSFIGLGVRPPQVELGALLASGKEYFQTAKWLITFPGLAIVFTVLGLNLVGEGLRDRLDL